MRIEALEAYLLAGVSTQTLKAEKGSPCKGFETRQILSIPLGTIGMDSKTPSQVTTGSFK